MKINISALSFLFLLTFDQAAGALNCSRTGTTVLYINGIFTAPGANTETAGKVATIVAGERSKIDHTIKSVIGVYNYSSSLAGDIQETKAQVAINHLGERRQEYWKKMALSQLSFVHTQREDLKKQIIEGFDQIYRTKPRVDPATNEVDPDYFSEMDLYKTLIKYEPQVALIYSRAYSDNATVEELKSNILKYYDKGKGKVIVVAHSQGNEVLYSAIESINAQAAPAYLNLPESLDRWSHYNNHWFNSVLGYVQIAPPSPRLVSPNESESYPSNLPKINHSRYLTANVDKIIGNAYIANNASPIPANLTYEESATKIQASKLGMSKLEILTKINGFYTFGYHAIDNFYLSNVFTAKNKDGKSDTMVQHFKDAIAEVASELESNCAVTVPSPTRALCQVWSRGHPDIEFFAYEDQLLGIEVNLPEGTHKYVGTSCRAWESSNGAPISSQGVWCTGENNQIVIQSIGEDTIVNFPYTSPCYLGRILNQNGVVPL